MSSSERDELPEGMKIASQFEVYEYIAEGGYGEIYCVTESDSHAKYAMKIEYTDAKKQALHDEIKILKKIQDQSRMFPKVIHTGKEQGFRFLVMELLGPSLSETRRAMPDQKFSKFTYLTIAREMVRCIKHLHKCNYIHRDIKPGNFLIRADRKNPLVLIDFGLSRCYISKKTGLHRRPREDAGYTGTVRYASIHAHDEQELSRRDDLISWFYSVTELAAGKTFWPGSEDKEKTIQMKREMTAEDLCSNLPNQFISIWNMIIDLKYEDMPNYSEIKRLIQEAIDQEKFTCHKFDWEFLSKEELSDLTSIPLDMEDPSEDCITQPHSKGENTDITEDREVASEEQTVQIVEVKEDIEDLDDINKLQPQMEGGCGICNVQ